MAAGLGFKDFVTGEVLTAADVDGYLMQGVWVFASATARDAAVTSPQEGNFAYLKDTNVTTYYTGSAWANLDTTGMTNPMTTTGDTIYSSSGSTPARLGIGSTGDVLTVAGGVPSWAAPASGGMTLLSTTTLSSATTSISVVGGYNDLYVQFTGIYLPSASQGFEIRYNTVSTGYNSVYLYQASGGATVENNNNQNGTGTAGSALTDANNQYLFGYIRYFDYLGTAGMKTFQGQIAARNDSEAYFARTFFGANSATPAAITQVQFVTGAASFSAGEVKIYGVK
jgi:hypothetical protein